MGDQQLTYEELEHASNRWARLLIASGVRPGDRVCLVQPKTPAAITSILATLKAGAIYVPIDVDAPAARMRRILDAADPRLILATGQGGPLLESVVRDIPIACADGAMARASLGPEDAASLDVDPLPCCVQPEDAAHILFTSGSTGEPKGVVITHAMVSAFLDWAMPHFGHRPGDRISSHPPLHFDLSTFDIFGALGSGAELHLVPPGTLLPNQLAAFIRDSQLTQWFSVPSTFAYMARFDAIAHDDFPSLERIIWCGEVLPPAVLAHWMHRVPGPTYTNLYGPTEATIASSFYTVPAIPMDDPAPIPIGFPCRGESIHVLDETLEPVAAGEIGELYIEGRGLSPGYWRAADQTRAAFPTDLRTGRRLYRTGDLGRRGEDGVLHFVGRADSQIKSRGYRIELGEIEAALSTVTGVAECAVVGLPSDGFEGTAICCAWVSGTGTELDSTQLRTALADRLPTYMLPSLWLCLDELPKNVNGKIDRRLVTEQFAASSAHR